MRGLYPTKIHLLQEGRLCPVTHTPRPAGCAAAPAGRSDSRSSTSCAQRSDGAGTEGTTQSDSQPHSHPTACPARTRTPRWQQHGRCRCQPHPRYLPAPRPRSGRGRHPEPEPRRGAAAPGSTGQPRRFREAFVPALPACLVRIRGPQNHCSSPFPGRCLPQRSRHGSAGQAPHQERRRRLGLRGRGEGEGQREAANPCAASCGGRGPMGGRLAEVRRWRWLELEAEEESGVRGRRGRGWRGLGRRRERGSLILGGLLVAVCRRRQCGQGRKPRRVCACGGANRSQHSLRSRSLSCPCCSAPLLCPVPAPSPLGQWSPPLVM